MPTVMLLFVLVKIVQNWLWVYQILTRSIAKIVRDIIDEDLTIQDALQRGYANVSAISRAIKPRVEESLGKRVRPETIITSLKRVRPSYTEQSEGITNVIAKSTINVRTDVSKLSLEKNKKNVDIVAKMMSSKQEGFLQVSEGLSSITIIYDQMMRKEMLKTFDKGQILEDTPNLAAITVHSPEEVVVTPGCAVQFLSQVSRRRINIEDIVGCYTDTVIVVKNEEVGKAFAALTDLIAEARRILESK